MENDIPPNVLELIPIITQTPPGIEPGSEEPKGGNQEGLQIHENEFVNGKLDERDQIIKDLKKSNRLIANEVQLIWQKLKQQPQKTKIRRKLIETSSNKQALQKQLENALQLIKIIEKEISRQKKKEKASKQMISKMKSIKKQLNERSDLSFSLKSDLTIKAREVKELQRKIAFKTSHNSSRELKAMTDEINHLFEVLSETEKREEEKMRTLKKQYEQVKKIQKNLIEKGISQSELELMKKRCIIEISPRKNGSFQGANPGPTESPKFKQKEERTQKKFNEMIHEIKILQRKQADFQEEYKISENQRRNYCMKNVSVQQQLNQIEQEIQSLSELSEKLRSKHILRHRKRERLRSLELQKVEEEKQVQLKMKRQQFKDSHQKRTRRFKSLPSATVNPEMRPVSKQEDLIKVQNKEEATTENTIFQKKVHKYGCGSEGGNKFKDRYILGNEHLGKKITQLTLYFEPSSQFVSGISVGYDNGIKGGDYIWRTEANEDFYKIQSYECANGYIRDIYSEFSQIEGKSRLTGVQIELNDGSFRTFGLVSRYESKLTEKEFVSSIFGVMSVITEEGNTFSAIEELGMEIYE